MQKKAPLRINQFIQICLIFLSLVTINITGGCTSQEQTHVDTLTITITDDNQESKISVPAGTTAGSAIEIAGISLSNLDEIEPPEATLLQENTHIQITRVTESYEVEESIIPFSRQTVRNESMPEGKTLIIQPGSNGLQRITYRILYKNGIEESKTVFKSEVTNEAKPEIIMIGVQSPFTAIPIQGTLAYLSSGNAWIMEENTGNRRPVITSGDLDGRIFSISQDKQWLLFTRKAEEGEEHINSIWIIDLLKNNAEPVNLYQKNIIHHADWIPGKKRTISFSTVEPRTAAPGWQANNDLLTLAFDEDGKVLQIKTLIEPNAGGIYGWWGTDYTWSPDGKRIAYARPDSIGMVNTNSGEMESLTQLIPLQTQSDWAWVPGLAWDIDHKTIFGVLHNASTESTSQEASPYFDLSAILPENELVIPLVKQTGMFAYPAVSSPDVQNRIQIAYLQAIFPEQSETSRYRLMVMDRDGSNRKQIFPADGSTGMDPQTVLWSPQSDTETKSIAIIYQNNLWLVDPDTGDAQQITGDSLINRIDWK